MTPREGGRVPFPLSRGAGGGARPALSRPNSFTPAGNCGSAGGKGALDDVGHVGERDGAEATCCKAFSAIARRPGSSTRQLFMAANSLRRQLWVLAIERQHRIRDEVVARAIGAVELPLVCQCERVDQGAHAIGIGKRECGDAP